MSWLGHLWIQQWKLQIIRSILAHYNDRVNLYLAITGFILCVLAGVSWQYTSTMVIGRIGVPTFYAYVMIIDIAFFALVVISLRKLTKMRTEVLNVETEREKFRVQAFLALSLASIIISGGILGGGILNYLAQDGLVNWLMTIQLASSYYYFYNVALVLGGSRRASSVHNHKTSGPKSTLSPPMPNIVATRRASLMESGLQDKSIVAPNSQE